MQPTQFDSSHYYCCINNRNLLLFRWNNIIDDRDSSSSMQAKITTYAQNVNMYLVDFYLVLFKEINKSHSFQTFEDH